MATIYDITKEFPTPKVDFANYNRAKAIKDEDEYLKSVKDFLLTQSKGKNVGEILNFPVADGMAQYMVAKMRPLALIHIALGDAYNFQYAHLLTAKEVNSKIDTQKRMDKIFS